mmetsp:Transcript_131445/g.262283  ORF Transcript_131445/g.262283 Transcript_131445/m.262283 type:complete len:269 (+) Transcript_131445:64-870(+)|eukprot:CAMPEP_0172664916 /NCGR_PEP_ID=MMETSP1074-20121228/6917_1 /TAXON_ID=2916 /ORGANISM="Ceratium fusus, Strain PA161109" /LENGTH=268 /DNA_ID=CAMNT_0013481153 /DNA_START=60 /DNA_END=866 /DNA_ORIENTATION=+
MFPGLAARAHRPARGVALPTIAAVCALALHFQQAFLLQRPLGKPAVWRVPHATHSRRVWRQAAGDLDVDGLVEPLGSNVLVKVKEAEEFSPGGILLVSKKEKPTGGEVVAVGLGELDSKSGVLKPVEVKPGAQVIYNKYGGTALKCSGVDHMLVRQDDILYSFEGADATLETVQMPRGMVLVQLQEGKEQTDGGLLLSRGAVKPSTTSGKVVAVGAGEWTSSGEAMDVKVEVGDMVRFRYGDEVELDIGDDKFSAVKMVNCIAKWKDV